LRRFLSLTAACTLLVFGGLARAQQIDFTVGGSTLFSSAPTSASLAYPPPAEKGGVYPDASIQIMFKRFGFNAEGAFRYKEGLYLGLQRYRPVLYDVNAVLAPHLTKKITADLMAGVGGESILFYNKFNCTTTTGSCPSYVSGNHFLLHAGAGPRYYFLGSFFVRPEAHYYFVLNNTQFHSDHILRLGASIGYTFGR